MNSLVLYVAILTLSLLALWIVVSTRAGETAGALAMLAAMYCATVFDLKFASERWSMFRRVLPSVALLDCLVYAVPFALAGYLISAPNPVSLDAELGWLMVAGVLILPSFGFYFLFRWQRMRRNSRDDLRWFFASDLSLAERMQLYLGQR